MNLLNRYIAREVLLGTALVLAALVMLFSFFDLIHELSDLGKGDYRIWKMFVFVGLAIPAHLYELFPIAALIGCLYGLTGLAAHSEIAVMRASGMSPRFLALAVLRAGVVMVVLGFLMGELVVPETEAAAQQWRLKSLNSVVATQFRSGLWVKDENSFINIQEMLPDTTLVNLKIYEFDTHHRLRSISTGQKGEYQGGNAWRLTKVEQTLFDQEKVRLTSLPTLVWGSVLTPAILGVLLVEPEQMSIFNLNTYIDHLRENGQKTARYEIALWSKVLYPFSILVMLLLALPFGLRRSRSGGIGRQIMTGIGLGLAFYLVNQLSSYLGQLNDWSPLVSTLAPPLLFLALALGASRVMDRRGG